MIIINSRKGEAMWWIIIGAVLALIVLIVLVVMFTDKGRGIEQGLTSCSGICTAANVKQCPVGTQRSSAFSCTTNGVCCIGFAKECTDNQDACEIDKEKCELVGLEGRRYCIEKTASAGN